MLENPRLREASDAERKRQATFRRGDATSHIDHLLISPLRGIAAKRLCTITDSSWGALSDHRPVLLDIAINNVDKVSLRYKSHLHGIKSAPPVDLDVSQLRKLPTGSDKDPPPLPKNIARYQNFLSTKLKSTLTRPTSTNAEASEVLRRIGVASVQVARRIQPKKKKGPDGWSPEYMCLKAELFANDRSASALTQVVVAPQAASTIPVPPSLVSLPHGRRRSHSFSRLSLKPLPSLTITRPSGVFVLTISLSLK